MSMFVIEKHPLDRGRGGQYVARPYDAGLSRYCKGIQQAALFSTRAKAEKVASPSELIVDLGKVVGFKEE